MKNVKLIKFKNYHDHNGDLVVIEESTKKVPFSISRVFNVSSSSVGSIRGRHAHKLCTQLLICTNGSLEVFCDNLFEKKHFSLNRPDVGLIISPGVWAEQKYLAENTVLTVLCDRPYEKHDYIHDYEEFKDFIQKVK